MPNTTFYTIFTDAELAALRGLLQTALNEDGPDLTSNAVFGPQERLTAVIVAKQQGVVAGLPLAELVLELVDQDGAWSVDHHVRDGQQVEPGTALLTLNGPARTLLRAERIILNFVGHLSGVATLTAAFVQRMGNTRTTLLDTRKTLPGLRRLQKYAVTTGGGQNHRMNLAELLMLKDTHLDRAGSMQQAVQALRNAYSPCPPIEVECRTLDEVRTAVGLAVSRIMLDNMDMPTMSKALELIPDSIETEISGGVNLHTAGELAALGADYISAGALTHSAPALDVSMRIAIPQSSKAGE